MDATKALLKILDQLLGPEGCPWDQKQTLDSCREHLIEEAAEVVDAIHSKNRNDIQEELGDLLQVTFFLCKLAEKEKVCTFTEIVQGICEKLIRRHPHIFKAKADLTSDQVLDQWNEIKKTEHEVPKHPITKIPKSLPALAQAFEMVKAVKKHQLALPQKDVQDEELQFGYRLLTLVEEAVKEKIDPELALRRVCFDIRSSF